MLKNDYQKLGHIYAKHRIENTGYLAFKNIPALIEQYAQGKKTLDYGCGSGRSTRFLKDLGLIVEGVDVSESMINEARAMDNNNIYHLIQSANIPSDSNTYDIVFSSLVLFEVSTKKELLEIFTEIHRVLKDDGVFIAVTGSVDMYSHDWLTLDANYEENKNLKSGSVAKILLKDIGLELYDYFWTHEDYLHIIEKSNFNLLLTQYPLGEKQDKYPWKSETFVAPYVVYILKKGS